MTAYSASELIEAVEKIAELAASKFLYFADSRGALLPEEASALYKKIRPLWPGHLGYHAHNNLGKAIENCKATLEAGCDIIDASVRGYGLGGRNNDLIATLDLLREYRPITADYKKELQSTYAQLATEMPENDAFHELYKLSGAKNLEQEWVPFIWEAYGKESQNFLEKLPKKLYKAMEEAIEDIPTK